ncbi:MAG: hypothetical protein MMC33_009285 [Icmadophila ericetorum]|nr:hypothetical protein [Icmadophila ericetorum]
MSAIKKLFNRKSKDMNSADESPVHQRTRLRKSTGDANVRQQFLDDTASRNQSEAKDFGKGSNRRSSISNSRRLSLRGFGRSSRTSLGDSQDVPQPVGPMATSQHSRGLSQDMADMDLNRNRQFPASSNTFNNSDYSYSPDAETRPSGGGYTHITGEQNHGTPTRKAVPRRDNTTEALSSYPVEPTSQPAQSIPDRTERASLQKPLPTAPIQQPTTTQISGASTHNATSTAEQVLQAAQTNTTDTEIIEKWNPAVVHETVHQDIHHIREEVITREIHTHDVYHRILPIIDVEVLPARHFLPVEGGGLVEISADEVPARANQHWVIAETASRIPSDAQVQAYTQRREFTAREFPGTEGDKVEYVGEDGVKRTEETWVHPPELETGGRETGQTWPMEFGSRSEGKERRRRMKSEGVKRKGREGEQEKRIEREEVPAGARGLKTENIIRG